jgi:hypothetical protein
MLTTLIDDARTDPVAVIYYRVSLKGDDGEFMVNRRAETKPEAYDIAAQVQDVFGYKPTITGIRQTSFRKEAWRVL